MNTLINMNAGRALLAAILMGTSTLAYAPARAASTYTYNFSSGDSITLGPLQGKTQTTRVCLLNSQVVSALKKAGYKQVKVVRSLKGKKIRSVEVQGAKGRSIYLIQFNRCTAKVESRKRIGTV